jgi:hypothetical protein
MITNTEFEVAADGTDKADDVVETSELSLAEMDLIGGGSFAVSYL